MAPPLRYYAAACQTDLPNPAGRKDIARQVNHMVAMIDRAVLGYAPIAPVRLVVFPEFGHAAPIYPTVEELLDRLAVPIPNEHTDRYHQKARQHGIFIQTASFLERDDRYPSSVFNTTCLVGPDGLLTRYRKVHTWIPWEVHASPHDLPAYAEELFPVADTEIGRIGAATCYDWLFPEAIRQLALAGAEVLVRVSAYMDPWGATPPMDWWTVVNRCRALENLAYVVAANQGARAEHYPPFTWPGGSMVVDYDGRILTQADPGPGEKIVVGPVDIAALRVERERRLGHHMLAHLRTETYPAYRQAIYPGSLAADSAVLTMEGNQRAIEDAKKRCHELARQPARSPASV
ncbi:MAG TPA: nitrilase-related carbon-nitrogen hydrolase [Gemmataceae bacterium]|jgi:predicted amidohydrolase|nr:nitrilase-related carbon-nitrogen hydrolase [Gemmataceae bacterium]